MAPNQESALADALEAVLRAGRVTAEVLEGASSAHFLALLPLALCEPPSPPLLAVLQRRLTASRAAKLRFLLICRHQAFQEYPYELRYSSAAYRGEGGGRKGELRPRAIAVEEEEEEEEEKEEQERRRQAVEKGERMRILVDMLDLQSLNFFGDTVFQNKGVEAVFGHVLISHPFAPTTAGNPPDPSTHPRDDAPSESSTEDGVVLDCALAQCASLKISHGRAVLCLQRLYMDDTHTAVHENLEALEPEVCVRHKDVALKSAATHALLRLLNVVWARRTRHFPDAGAGPFCIVPDAVPVAASRSLEAVLRKSTPLRIFNFEYWACTRGLNPAVVDGFVRSAAGAYTAAYVLGLGERHGDELGVTDGVGIYFRSLRGAMEHEATPSSGRVTVPNGMRRQFEQMKVWDTFRQMCVRAFAVVRECHEEVVPVVAPLFEKAGVTRAVLESHMRSRYALNLEPKDERHADVYFKRWLG